MQSPMTRNGPRWLAAMATMVLLAIPVSAQTVTVNITLASDFLPLGINQQGEAAVDAEASLDLGSSSNGDADGPTWSWQILLVEYLDEFGVWQPASLGDAYAYMNHPDKNLAAAKVMGTFFIATDWRVSVRATATFFVGGLQFTGKDEKTGDQAQKGKVGGTFDFRAEGAISINSASPPTNSKVSANQTVGLVLYMGDFDEYKATAAKEWIPYDVPWQYPGKYTVKLTLTNAKFADKTRQADVVANRPNTGTAVGMYVIQNVTIDKDWDGTNPVKIDIVVTDLVEVLDTVALGPGIKKTDIQDAPKNLPSMEWTKATVFPTELKRVAQAPGDIGTVQNTKQMLVTQQAGIKPAPEYQGVTVDEIFSPWTSNLAKDWLIKDLLDMKPNFSDADWRDYYYKDVPFETGSFAIGADNKFLDEYSADVFGMAKNGLSVDSLNEDGKKATLLVQSEQRYKCPPDTDLLKATLRLQRAGNAKGGGVLQMQSVCPAQ